ncbi:MAG: mandelate racemase/muconate lactonizing enzyme family protein [Solirubrobacteraceae bacterium]
MRLEVQPRELRFRDPVGTAFGVIERRRLLVVRLCAEDGTIGCGEAAPLEPYDGVALRAVRAEIESCRDVLADGDAAPREELLEACRARCSLPQALAAIDLALWDMAGRRAHRPVARLLAADAAVQVPVNATIGATERAQAASQAEAAAASGFRCLKLKVGLDGDGQRLAAVRAAAGRRVAIRLDANGAWSVEEAVRTLRRFAIRGIELCEEPVHGVDALRAVRAALEGRVPIAMDETASQPGAVTSAATDAVCLKIAGAGGISGVVEAARAARAAGSEVYLASTFDGPLGIAAGLHAAAALRVQRPCGLATLDLFADAPDPFPARRGAIAVPDTPGLGVP